jgi:tRNA threonylcarbamoyladenosine biosynthesis protein TsaB
MDLAAQVVRWAPDVVVGDAPTAFADELKAIARTAQLVSMRASAASIAACALAHWLTGEHLNPARATPLYVRDHVALTIDERRAARRQTP